MLLFVSVLCLFVMSTVCMWELLYTVVMFCSTVYGCQWLSVSVSVVASVVCGVFVMSVDGGPTVLLSVVMLLSAVQQGKEKEVVLFDW